MLDAAGYGFVSINKPVTIIAPPGVYAGISVTSGHGIDVNPGAGRVVLRGLTLTGLGGDFGINMMSGDALYIENCVIGGFSNTGVYAVPSMAVDGVRPQLDDPRQRHGRAASAPRRAPPACCARSSSTAGSRTTAPASASPTAAPLGTISDTTVIGGAIRAQRESDDGRRRDEGHVRKSTFTKASDDRRACRRRRGHDRHRGVSSSRRSPNRASASRC